MSKLVQTAKRCKEILQNTKYKLDMSDWATIHGREWNDCTFKADNLKEIAADENACGTSYCLAGFLALEDNYPGEFIYDGHFCHVAFAEAAIGSGEFSHEYRFLFDAYWNSSLELAHKRLDYVIEHGSVPDFDEWKEYGYEQ